MVGDVAPRWGRTSGGVQQLPVLAVGAQEGEVASVGAFLVLQRQKDCENIK